jgi:hypothetical protein
MSTLRFTWDRDEGVLRIVSPGSGSPIRRAPELYEAELIEEIERLRRAAETKTALPDCCVCVNCGCNPCGCAAVVASSGITKL